MLRLLAALLALLLLPVVLIVVLLAALQSETVRYEASALVTRLVPGVEIEGLGPGLPFRLELARVRLTDAAGPWLEIDGFNLDLDALALVQGTVGVRELAADLVHVRRLPEAGEDAAEVVTEPRDEPFRLPESLPRFALERLELRRIQIDEPVIGEALDLRLEGSAHNRDGALVTAALDLERLDQAGLSTTLRATLDLAAHQLDLDLAAVDETGLVDSLAGDTAIGAVRLDLAGSGPLTAWPARLGLVAEEAAEAGLDLVLGLDGDLRLQLDGQVRPRPQLIEGPLFDLVGEGIDVGLDLVTVEDGLALRRLALTTTWLDLSGTARLQGQRLQATIDGRLDDLSPLQPLVDEALEGRATLRVDLDGQLPLPAGTVELTADDLRLTGLAVDRIQQRLVATPSAGDEVDFALEGQLGGLRYTAPNGTFADDVDLEVRGNVAANGPFRIDRLRLDAAAMAVQAAGSGDFNAGDVAATVTASLPDFAAFTAFVPDGDVLPRGAAALTLDADLRDAFEQGTLTLAVDGTGLSGLPAPATSLIGPRPRLHLEAERRGPSRFVLHALELVGANLTLEAGGEIDVDGGPLALRARLDVPDLAPVGQELDQPLAGTLSAEVEAAGTVDAPEATLVAAAAGLEAAGQRFETVRIEGDVGGTADDLVGGLTVTARKDAGELRLATPYRVQPERVQLDALRLQAPGLAFEGNVDVDLATTLVTARLAGGSTDLRPLGRWLELPLQGRLDLDLDLTAPEGRQDARLRATASNLVFDQLRLERAQVRADVADLLGALRLDARAEVRSLVQDTVVVDTAELRARGDLAGLDVELSADGSLPDPFTVRGAGTFRQEDDRGNATLTALTGEVADVPVRLLRPAVVRWRDGLIELEGLELEVDAARLELRGSLAPDQVRGDARLTGVDLARLGAFGAPDLQGAVALDAALRGTPAAPRLQSTLTIQGLAPGLNVDAVTLDVTSQLAIEPNRLDLATTVVGLGEPSLDLRATVPVRFRIEPFAFELADPLPLEAQLSGPIDLQNVEAFLALDGQILRGRLDTDIQVSGTSANPNLVGRASLTGGRIEDVTVGALLTDVALELVAENERLVVRRFTARDGMNGTLGLTGAVVFGGPDTVRIDDLALSADRFMIPQRDDLKVELSGRATLDGTPEAMAVFGRFTVNSGEIRIPETGARSFRTLDVIEVADLDERAAPPPPDAVSGIDLDVVVDIPGRLFVRGRGLVSEWGGQIAVTGDATAPRVVGNIGYRRGQLDLLGRRFLFRKGEITLDGAFPPDPLLDIETAVQLSDIVAVLAISGPALDPSINAFSEPPLPEDEVLSRLIFDRGVERLNAVQALRLAAAVETLRAGNGGVLETTRNLFGLDTIDVAGESVEDASLRAGVYVTDQIFLQLEQGLAPGSGSARVEIELTPRLRAETEVREDQTSSVGLRWSYDY
ncbi:MAG: hypothetical protein EA356_16725 [Geminicoccaceae bacterium]|nr:MAG: hypothetical protein EA356_16725 [Geminicoccaceae bacterium]